MSAAFKTEAEVPSSSAISRRVGSRQAVEGVVVKTEEAARAYTPAPNETDDERQIRLKAAGRAYALRGTAELSLPVSNNTVMIKKEELERDEDNQWTEFFENCTNNNDILPDSVSSSTRNRTFMEDSSMINNNKNKNTLVWGDGTKTSGLLANTTITTVTDGSIIPSPSTEGIISKKEIAAKNNNDNNGDGNLKPAAVTKEEPTTTKKKKSAGSTSTTTTNNNNTTTPTRTSVGASKGAFTAASRAIEFAPVEAS